MNNHLTMRQTDPLQLTPLERLYDEMQRFANRERYCLQSANTRDGARADIAPRPRLSRGEKYASEQSPETPITRYADRRGV